MLVTVPCADTCMEIFDLIDFSGTGLLSIVELEQAVTKVWPNYHHKSAILIAYRSSDLNCDGFIGRNEFELFLRFLAFYNNLWGHDTNGDQLIDKEEFMEAASELEIGNAKETFGDIDVNQNGHIKYEEFISWMAKRTLDRGVSHGGSFRFANSGSARALGRRSGCKQAENPEVPYIARLIMILRCSIDSLNGQATDEMIEGWAILIHGCMSNTHRVMHGMDLMFEISFGADPTQRLAILFSYVVSYRFDGGLLFQKVQDQLETIMNERDSFVINDMISHQDDACVNMVMSIFGVSPGNRLDPYELDKFLSSIVAVRCLKESLPLVQLAKIVVCIEATVRFEKGDASVKKENGHAVHGCEDDNSGWFFDSIQKHALQPRTSLDSLYGRLVKTNDSFCLCMMENKMVKAIQRAADTVNRFRGVFATDTASHLAKMWALLPEFNPALRQPKLYTVLDYHVAIKNLEKLMCFTGKHDFFMTFGGVPDAQEMAALTRKFKHNAEMGRLYVHSKAVSCSIIAAFTVLTGGDVPYCFMMGDPVSGDRPSYQMGDGLPYLSPESLTDCNKEMYQILSNPGMADSFDCAKSKMTALVYGILGDGGILKALKHTDYPFDKSRAMALLSSLPMDIVVPIGYEISKIAISRIDRVMELLDELAKRQARFLSS